MQKKKFVLSLVVVFLLCWAGVAAAAEGEPALDNREEALERAEKLFPELVKDRKGEVDVDFREDSREERNYWRLNWHSEVQNDDVERFSIGLGAQDGKLYNYNFDPKESASGKKVLTRSEAREVAEKFAREYQPEKMRQAKLDVDYGQRRGANRLDFIHSFRWNQSVNGVSLQNNSINVRVDTLTGNVVSFHCNWGSTEDLPCDPELSKSEITEKVTGKLGLYPLYIIDDSSDDGLPEAKLVYRLNTSAHLFDGASGKPVDIRNGEISWEEAANYERDFEIKPAPEKTVDNVMPEKDIDTKEALKKAENFLAEMGFEGEVDRTGGSSVEAPGYKVERWRYSVEPGEGNMPHHRVSVSINVKTGEIDRFDNRIAQSSGGGEKGQDEISEQEAIAKAKDFLGKLAITTKGMIRRDQSEAGEENSFHFTWVRLVNGVPFSGDNVKVSINKNSGKVVSFDRHKRPVKSFASTEGIISEEKAMEVFKEEKPFELDYLRVQGKTGGSDYVLGYRVDYGGIDAHTGEIEDHIYREEGISLQAYEEKIGEHWARKPLTVLAEFGMLPGVEEFNPAGTVKRIEALRVLGKAAERYYHRPEKVESPFEDVGNDYKKLEDALRAVNAGIIEPEGKLAPGAALTREDLAVWLVNGLGYKEVAEADVSMNPGFKDASGISSGKENYVTIAAGMDMLSGYENNEFRPQKPVTWGELASVVVRAAPHLRN